MLTEVGPVGGAEGTDFDLGRADEHNVVFASVISRDHRDAVVIGTGVRDVVGGKRIHSCFHLFLSQSPKLRSSDGAH